MNCYKSKTVLIVLLLLFISNFISTGKAEENVKKMFSKISVTSNVKLNQKLNLAQINQLYMENIKQIWQKAIDHEKFQQAIRDFPVEEKLRATYLIVNKLKKEGRDLNTVMRTLVEANKKFTIYATSGSIQGTVTVNGQPPVDEVEVMAFDKYGFLKGGSSVSFDGSYEISGLPAGDYYVLTESNFVDEFYNDVPLAFFTNWRNATLVTVPEGGTASDINFDLAAGAKVTGKIFEADGMTPIAFNQVVFNISGANNPEVLFSPSTMTGSDGSYEINIPATGSFKIQATVTGFQSEYYNNKADWASADAITINSLSDSLGGIDFTLEKGAMATGAVISGTVFDPTGNKYSFAFVFAFNTADTSVAGFAISGLTAEGEYSIDGLEPGTYILFAQDFLGPYRGVYHPDADTPDGATPVTVGENESKTGVDFNLKLGGLITGKIEDTQGAALDSILVLAVKTTVTNIDGFFTDNVDLGFGISDQDGNYMVFGLSGGDYILRTVSLLSPHAGEVLDEYYQDVHSLFAFDQATPVTVSPPLPTPNIDFVLEPAGAIRGHFFETDGTTPVMGTGTVIAFDSETGLPELALTQFDTLSGAYELRPLPEGNFLLLGLVDSGENSDIIYLPQFYNGASSFEDATPVGVMPPDVTDNINFNMVRAATLQGFVLLDGGFPAGADSLSNTIVVAFDASTGEAAGSSEMSFSGGYRIKGLAPGNYKVAALTGHAGFAGTYFGGGNTFDDPNNQNITLGADQTSDANITLTQADGAISGTVYNADGTIPVNGALVLAYDMTGHVVDFAISGFDLNTGAPISPGQYKISGLVTGGYYVRTFALFSLLSSLSDINISGGQDGGGIFGVLFGLLTGSASDILGNLQLFGDVWYPGVNVTVDLDPFNLLIQLLSSTLSENIFVPFFDMPPSGAKVVNVTSPGETTGIDFFLPPLQQLLTDVPEVATETIPETYRLHQNFPNPFNPGTTIRYELPATSQVSVVIYNVLGQKIRSLVDTIQPAGNYRIQWDGTNDLGEPVAAGVYFVSLKTDKLVLSRKMLLIR